MTRAILSGDNVIMKRVETYEVFYRNGRVFKRQPKFLTDNEYYFLKKMQGTGYVPSEVRREDVSTVSMEHIRTECITNIDEWMSHLEPVLETLLRRGIRHGDLTVYSVIPNGNRPYLIDFAESRTLLDEIPDKRPEGDRHWLTKTMSDMALSALCGEESYSVHVDLGEMLDEIERLLALETDDVRKP